MTHITHEIKDGQIITFCGLSAPEKFVVPARKAWETIKAILTGPPSECTCGNCRTAWESEAK